MGNGLLAQWHRRVVARGLVGAVFFAIPVAVAAAIGFGTSLSGVAGGLSAIAEGPTTTTTPTQVSAFKINRAVKALSAPNSHGSSALNAAAETGSGSGVGAGGGSTTGVSGTGGAGGETGTSQAPTITSPGAPDIPLPGGGSSTDTANQVNNGVTDVINGVTSTLNGLLGGK